MAKSLTKFILATKVGMTQMFTEKGDQVGVTLLRVAPNVVIKVRTQEKNGYGAVQLGTGAKKATRLTKSAKGQFGSATPTRWLKEFKATQAAGKDLAVGDVLDVSVFAVGDIVRTSSLTKGKGFAGAVKRHGFRGAPASHGHHHVMRHVGSIGQRFPQHTLKGTRGPGRDGQERVSVRGLKVMAVEPEQGILAVKGSVPGAKGSIVEVIAL